MPCKRLRPERVREHAEHRMHAAGKLEGFVVALRLFRTRHGGMPRSVVVNKVFPMRG